MKTITYNPETHVLVPREPSQGMIDAMPPVEEIGYWAMYEAAIAAAPQPEPVDVEPAMWVMKHIRSGDLAQAKPNQKALHPYMWSDAFPRYTTPQPDRVTTKESYVELDIHSNPSRTGQQRKLDGSLEVGQLLGNGQNQETSHPKTVGDILLADAFRGDAANLIESIVALVSLDRAGVLVPHGIGGHARSLLESAAIRLSQPDRTAELEAALKVAREALANCAADYLHADSVLTDSALAKINEVLGHA